MCVCVCVYSAAKPEELQAALSRIAELEAELEQKQTLLEVLLSIPSST